jgi:hypothetical protein
LDQQTAQTSTVYLKLFLIKTVQAHLSWVLFQFHFISQLKAPLAGCFDLGDCLCECLHLAIVVLSPLLASFKLRLCSWITWKLVIWSKEFVVFKGKIIYALKNPVVGLIDLTQKANGVCVRLNAIECLMLFFPFRGDFIFRYIRYIIGLQTNYIEAVSINAAQVCYLLFLNWQSLDAPHQLQAVDNCWYACS